MLFIFPSNVILYRCQDFLFFYEFVQELSTKNTVLYIYKFEEKDRVQNFTKFIKI